MIRIGTAGWSIPKQHSISPPNEKTHLENYSRVFCCAEINSTFYRSHRPSTWQRWAESVPENFRFSVKAPQAITHEAALDCGADPLKTFLAEVKLLEARLGPILFQLPPGSAFRPAIAESFFTSFRNLYSGCAALEPRHPTWFTSEADRILQKLHIARVAADPARIPSAAAAGGWTNLLYCRLHGSPRMYYSPYPDTYLRSLAAAIARQPPKEIWCIFDNTASGAAFGNGQIVSRLLAINEPDQAHLPA